MTLRKRGGYDNSGETAKPPEFKNAEERDAWQIATYGHVRNAFREPDEPPDGRPLIYRDPFWKDASEQSVYEHASATNPRRPGEGAMSYIARLAAIAEARLKSVPKVRLPPAAKVVVNERQLTDGQWNERSNELEKQREALVRDEPGSDG